MLFYKFYLIIAILWIWDYLLYTSFLYSLNNINMNILLVRWCLPSWIPTRIVFCLPNGLSKYEFAELIEFYENYRSGWAYTNSILN